MSYQGKFPHVDSSFLPVLCDRPNIFTNSTSGYPNNFGHSISGEAHRGVEGIIVVQTLKEFVTRLAGVLEDPTASDNVVCQ